MKPSSKGSFGALALAVSAIVVTLPAFAQDGAAPPPAGEPVNPSQGSASGGTQTPATSPATSPSAESSTEPADDSKAPGNATPAEPPVALEPLASQKTTTRAQPSNDADIAQEPDDGKLRYHQDHWLVLAGFRVASIKSEGFDPFADSDDLAQFSLGFGRTIMTAGDFSIAGLFLWDVGGRSGEARGAESDLTVHRLTLGGEGRYHFIRQLFVFGRIAPGAIHSIAKIEDPSVDVDSRAARKWVFATDLSAGASFELSGWSKDHAKRHLSAWITVDGGYGFAAESELSLVADGSQGPERSEPVDLGPLALGGPFFRGALVVTY